MKSTLKMFEDLKNSIESEAISDLKDELDSVYRENEDLRHHVNELEVDLKHSQELERCSRISEYLISSLMDKLSDTADSVEWRRIILNVVKLCLTPTFEVNDNDVYEAPLWLVLSTMFYDNRDKIIELLDLFKIERPSNIDQFILPCDWNESDVDLFFDNMRMHSNCNGSTYEGNLRFWGRNAVDPYSEIVECVNCYDEVPWQFLLRNPLLHEVKYLEKIGSNMFSNVVSNWDKFSKMTKYQEYTDDELRIIMDNIDVTSNHFRDKSFYGFIFDNIHVLRFCRHKKLLDKFYTILVDSNQYACLNKTILMDMPEEYLIRWLSESDWKDATNYLAIHQNQLIEKKGIKFFSNVLQNVCISFKNLEEVK